MNLYMQALMRTYKNIKTFSYWNSGLHLSHASIFSDVDREYDKDKIINDLVKLGSIVVENGVIFYRNVGQVLS